MSRQLTAKGVVWIDLTDMLAWKGTYTGIQRVTFEYASRFEKDGAHFFAYDALDKRYVEVALCDIYESHDLRTKKGSQEEPISLKRRIRLLVSKPYRGLSPNARAFLFPYAFALNHTVRSTIHYTRKLWHTKKVEQKHTLSSEYRHKPRVEFAAYDTVVLLGAGWNDSRALDGIIEYKQHTPIRVVQHINDILPIYQPQLFADELPKVFIPYIEKVVRNVDVITVISEATKRDIEIFCKEYSVAEPAIEVIRLGDNPESAVAPLKPRDDRIKPKKYILSVGTFEVRKNYQLLYQAVKLAQVEKRELPMLVIAGRPGWLSGDIRHIISRDPFVREHIVWLDAVSDEELKWLYGHCMFTVFPSIAEGWGLPVAESLNYGKFCLTSGASAMLEIGKGMVDYFLPYDPRECMEKMQYYLFENRYMQANERISNSYTSFTWDESYIQLADVLQGR